MSKAKTKQEQEPLQPAEGQETEQKQETLQAAEGQETEQKQERAKYKVAYPNGLNLRTGPGRRYPVIRVLSFDAEVEVVGTAPAVAASGTWWAPTTEGWVDSTYLTPVETEG